VPHSLTDTNLRLLDGKIRALGDTAYFDQRVIEYLESLEKIIGALLKPVAPIPNPIRDFMAREIWRGVQFLAGSAMRLQPFEAVYGLQAAAKDWLAKDALIITALIQEHNFFFAGIHPWFREIAGKLLSIKLEEDVVQVALPEIYRHKPLFSVALYHEFGHFIDRRFQVSGNVELLYPELVLPSLSGKPPTWTEEKYQEARSSHLREYFADLFAASYTGGAYRRFLDDFAADADVTASHPRTGDRIEVIRALVDGRPHVLIDAFQTALRARRCPGLELRYELPSVGQAFDHMRTATLESVAQIHGVLEAGWEYLDRAADRPAERWCRVEEHDAERIANDLVAKSIRNWMIRGQWDHAAAAS
jgi:hypothetical protein